MIRMRGFWDRGLPGGRILRGVTAGMLLAALMLGCGADRDVDNERTPLRVYLMLLSSKQVGFYQWAERTYEAANPDIDIIIEQFPGASLKDFEIKLRLRFASGKAPDIFVAHEHVGAELARLGLLDPAPDYIEKMVQENSLNAMVRSAPYFDGTCYGIVNDAVWQVLYYNKDMFREAGLDPEKPPVTWEELLDYADRLTVRNSSGKPVRTGLSLRKTGYKPGTSGKWYTYLYSAGGRPYSPDGTKATFNSEAGREALELYREILFEKNIDSVELEGDQQGFGQKRVAMFFREIHVLLWLREHYPDLDFGVGPVPAREASISQGGSYLFLVSKDSPYTDSAWRFIEWVMSDESYSRYVGIGGVTPTTKSVAALPEYQNDPKINTFLEQRVAPTESFPRVSRADGIVGAYIERFCYGDLTVDETLRRAEEEVNALLSRNVSRK